MVFGGLRYYPSQAWDDFLGSYDDIPDALRSVAEVGCDWYQIVDAKTGVIVGRGNRP